MGFGTKGSDYLDAYDIGEGAGSLIDLFSLGDLDSLRRRAGNLGRRAKSQMNRQLSLGKQRSRGASSVSVELSAHRYMRSRLDKTLRKVQAMAEAKDRVMQMGSDVAFLEMESKNRASMSAQASKQAGQSLYHRTGIAGIKTGERASRKRALYKGLQTAAGIGLMFVPGGQAIGAGMALEGAAGSISPSKNINAPGMNVGVGGSSGLKEFFQDRTDTFDLWGTPKEEFSSGLNFGLGPETTSMGPRRQTSSPPGFRGSLGGGL